MSNSRLVLVTGATGKQGGAVVRSLLSRGHRVRALTRNPASEAAKGLAGQGVEIARGDFDDEGSLGLAMRDVDAVFAMSTPFEGGPERESRQTWNLINVAHEVEVPHFIYTSVGSADQKTGIPHFDSKAVSERDLANTRLPATVLGPVYFMENLFFQQTLDAIRQGVYAVPMSPGRLLQQVAVADIGAMAALVVERREEFLGKRIDLAGDALSGAEVASALSDALGREIAYFQVPLEMVRAMNEDFALMYDWFERVGYRADIDDLRARYPEVGWQRFRDWLSGQDLSAFRA